MVQKYDYENIQKLLSFNTLYRLVFYIRIHLSYIQSYKRRSLYREVTTIFYELLVTRFMHYMVIPSMVHFFILINNE